MGVITARPSGCFHLLCTHLASPAARKSERVVGVLSY